MTELRGVIGRAADVESRAATFLEKRKLGRWGIAEQRELDDWLAESTAHRVAFLRLAESEALAERVSDLAPRDLKHFSLAVPVKWLRFGGLALAASLGAVALIGIAASILLTPPPDRDYATGVGGFAKLKFADGSEVDLNTNSAIRYRMTTAERTVWLERGEAYFKVAHDTARPFSVIAAGQRVTDLGTEFVVSTMDRALDVLLVKGRAQVSAEASGPMVATLTPGDEAIAGHGKTTIQKRSPQRLQDALAWRRGVVVFRDTPLAEAVRDFNRYNEKQLVVGDNAIANLKFSAELKTDDYADFLELAQSIYGIKVLQRGSSIYLYGNNRARRHSRR